MSEDIHECYSRESSFLDEFAAKVVEWERLEHKQAFGSDPMSKEATESLEEDVNAFVVDAIVSRHLPDLRRLARSNHLSTSLQLLIANEIMQLVDNEEDD